MQALYRAQVPRSVIFRHDARLANERRWCIKGLNTPPVVYQACIKYTTGGVVSIAEIQTSAQSTGIL